MKTIFRICAMGVIAAVWALLEQAPMDLLSRCKSMGLLIAAAWGLVELCARTTPPDDAAKWIERNMPAERLHFLAARRVFAVALGVIFLVAFWSWGSQVRGLVGARGLLPVGEQLAAARTAGFSFWHMPSLSWLVEGDSVLLAQCWLGALLAVAMCAGFSPGACALACWALYLSLTSVGGVFASFQWDALLLETSLLAALWLPWRMRPDWTEETLAQRIGRWLLWWLFVRLMFESGIVKLTWNDPSWLDRSALDFHFETQPLPLWTAWYAHQAPQWMLRAACWIMYFIEIVTPVLLLEPPRWRFLRPAAVWLQVMLQLVIISTGNYTFFNWLTIALCIPFLDDSFRGFRRFRRLHIEPAKVPLKFDGRLFPAVGLALASLACSSLGIIDAFGGLPRQEIEMRRTGGTPNTGWLQPLRSFNGYGLFRTMTKSRLEIILEGSADGVNWHEYEFPYKAGNVYNRPALVAPFQPRLDWQMWFAALAPQQYGSILERLMRRVLECEPTVLALLEKNPFAANPPQSVRLSFYEYHFTRFSDRGAAWWKRDFKGSTEPLSVDSSRRAKESQTP